MTREDPQLKLRVTEDMKNWLAEAAKANGRSVNAEIVGRLEASDKGGGAEAAEWKRRFDEEHQAFLRINHMFTQQMRLSEDYANSLRSRNREIYQQASIIESLSSIMLSLEAAPNNEVRDMATRLLEAAQTVKKSFNFSNQDESS